MEPTRAVLDGLGVQWTVMGALAALRYRGEPRLTTDLDVLVSPHPGLGEAFRLAGFDVREVADPGEAPHLLVIRGRGVRVDLLVVTTPYQQMALDRAVDGALSAEDVIVHKLIAWRPRDRDDIVSILRSGTPIDEAYVERWAGEWEVADRWEQARRAR